MSDNANNKPIQQNLFEALGITYPDLKIKKKRKPKSSKEIRFSSKDDMEPHSEAKVGLYGKYLEKYLAILGVVPFITKINIFDVFCGTGLYGNGKLGSPIMAYNVIKTTNKYLASTDKVQKQITLVVNDGNAESVAVVSSHLSALNKEEKHCDLEFFNLNSDEMFSIILKRIKLQSPGERNLIFIDPTGYKEIKKAEIFNLLVGKQSEIVLFLPISFMYRFHDIVQRDFENQSYVQLRRFIHEFFDENHPVRKNHRMDVTNFLNYIKDALTFNNTFFCSSFFLQRGVNNIYGLFFITPNILGLEKIIDAKWQMDTSKGEGFTNGVETARHQQHLFISDESLMSRHKLSKLEELLITFLSDSLTRNNCNLYKFILINDYKISHAVQILVKWQKESKLLVLDVLKEKPARKRAFYITYDNYKAKNIKVNFIMTDVANLNN